MKVSKYVDMAYGNPRGCEWINIIHEPEVWSKWVLKVQEMTKTPWIYDTDRAEKILIAAIWHFGYARDTPSGDKLRRTALRLRRGEAPPERGAGVSNRGFASLNGEIGAFGMPLEFWELDNFLEHVVRPRMDTLTKITK